MTTNSIKIRSIQFLGRDGWVQLSKVGGAEDSRWDMPVAMECRSYSVTLDELLESRRARGVVIKRQSDEIERLGGALQKLIREYRAERDSLYEFMTNAAEEYDTPDDERSVKEMDAVLDEAEAARAAMSDSAPPPEGSET